VSLITHLMLASPFVATTALAAGYALLWRDTGKFGPTTEFWYQMLLLFGVPTAAYLWSIQRWWRRGPWLALAVMDGFLVCLTSLGVLTGSDLVSRTLASLFLVLSITAAATLVVLARRGRGTMWGPMEPYHPRAASGDIPGQ
jgi:hypothetical protein